MWTILKKELADNFSSIRFLILACLIFMVALVTTYMVGSSLREASEGYVKPSQIFLLLFTEGKYISLAGFIAFFSPLMGIILGFDAINREHSQRTLPKLLSQPVYRDAVINAKFLGGVITISIVFTSLVLLVSGLGLLTLGVVPSWDEVGRLLVYLVVSIFYVSFWLGLAILFSILFRSLATSALASVAIWLFFTFFIGFFSDLIAGIISPIHNPEDPRERVKFHQVSDSVSLLSPVVLYSQATSIVLDPTRRTAKNLVLVRPLETVLMQRFQRPLPLGQSLLLVFPHLVLTIALTLICFWISYVTFMRQEIRSL